MGLFEPDKYRTKDKEERQVDRFEVAIEGADKKALERGAERGRIIGESANFTRDLANEPGGYLTPTAMADRAKQVAKQFGLSIDVLDQKQMRETRHGFVSRSVTGLRRAA